MRKVASRLTVLALVASAVLASVGVASASAVSCVPGSAPAPLVRTESASSVTGSGATLNGRVDPSGCPTTYRFEYGKTTSYGFTTIVSSAGSGTSYTPVAAAVTGLAAHTTYHFRVTATNAGGTTNGKDMAFTTSCPAPLVVTDPASAITATGATLHGRVNPQGCSTSYRFQYGTTTSYGSQTALHSAGSGTRYVSEAATISGLHPATTYHYRIIAIDSGSTSDGQDGTFTTSCAKPLAITDPASAITATGATLNGRVNPQGCSTSYRFEYGKTTAYGSSTPLRSAGAGTSYAAAMDTIGGLAPHTTYHFRIVANDSAGTTRGNDRTFTTPNRCASGSGFAPLGVTGAASAVTASTATLSGRVDPQGCPTSYEFQYGTTTGYGNLTPAQSAGSGTGYVPVVAAVGGLAPETTYHFRIVVSSAAGTNAGADMTFRTGCAAPVAITDGPSGITLRSAALHGRVDPRGCATRYRFQYGTTTRYGHQTAVRTAGNGTSFLPVGAAIGGLRPHTTYHYRLVAASGGGIVAGADRTFATPARATVGILSSRAPVTRGFVAHIRLVCLGSTGRCTGTIKLWHNRRVIGERHFSLRRNRTAVVAIALNERGRNLMRHHKHRIVEVVAASRNNKARRSVTLVRT